ncbi:alanine racemase [Thioflavicoccus mobilis 8321]|uniref:Alanine racemase n=1 Tax=Thioflavicoccus mobilis 8321 TaxID=765912 RepID=L0GYB2_9GAMM|nr:alanine racemase [Thioflavicoccus mobilis]AGA90299.1 alanine racemase [Thioflavicoccus mobilis 8321]
MTWSAPCARIDHAALRHNLAAVRRFAPASRVWAVVKANGYGHGLEAVAATLAEADGLAVARVEEGVRLRRAGIRRPILVLEGMVFADELAAATRDDLALAIHNWDQARLLARGGELGVPPWWLKVDTGMHRLGFPPAEVDEVLGYLANTAAGSRLVGLLTHLAKADEPEDPASERQCAALGEAAAGRGLPLSIGNSAGLIALPAARSDWVRPGIMLYGASPFATGTGADLGLRPVMTLQTRLIAIQSLPRGAAVGYGGTYVCPEDMRVGIVGIGYGDGYPRHAPTGTPVLLNGERVPLIGRVSMDMIHVDLRGRPQAAVGDLATLWGVGLPVEEIATRAGTIAYELLCRVAQRVQLEHDSPAVGDGAAG